MAVNHNMAFSSFLFVLASVALSGDFSHVISFFFFSVFSDIIFINILFFR